MVGPNISIWITRTAVGIIVRAEMKCQTVESSSLSSPNPLGFPWRSQSQIMSAPTCHPQHPSAPLAGEGQKESCLLPARPWCSSCCLLTQSALPRAAVRVRTPWGMCFSPPFIWCAYLGFMLQWPVCTSPWNTSFFLWQMQRVALMNYSFLLEIKLSL